jgi:CheY-like chemotaxis protein
VVDAHESIREAISICRAEIDAAGIDLTLDLAAAEHHVRADPARLQQVFWNLVKNATKFTPPGGTIAIRTRNRVDEDNSPGVGLLVAEVSDTGMGIEPELLPRIFEEFEQGQTAPRRRAEGLGLGLAIGRSLAEAHGGRLTAASPGRGQGTTFTLDLPTVAAPYVGADRPSVTPVERPRGEALRILLLEDNKDTLRYISLVLGLSHHRVRTAERLSEAREAAAAEEFDLLISDIELPDGTGLDLMRQIGGGRRTPGIAMSGYGSEEDIRQSKAAGFAEHLVKPIDVRRLEEAIHRVVARPG